MLVFAPPLIFKGPPNHPKSSKWRQNTSKNSKCTPPPLKDGAPKSRFGRYPLPRGRPERSELHFRLNVDQNFMCFLDPLKNFVFAHLGRPRVPKSCRIELWGSFWVTPGFFRVPKWRPKSQNSGKNASMFIFMVAPLDRLARCTLHVTLAARSPPGLIFIDCS